MITEHRIVIKMISVKWRNTIIGGKPNSACGVFQDGEDIIERQTLFVWIEWKGLSVKFDSTSPVSAEPQVAGAVFEETDINIIPQALLTLTWNGNHLSAVILE